jgi:hypothetical protein
MRKAFNDSEKPKGTGKHAEDPLGIVNDPTILAGTELGKAICTLSSLFR